MPEDLQQTQGEQPTAGFLQGLVHIGKHQTQTGRFAVVLGDEGQIPVGNQFELAEDTIELFFRKRHGAPVLGPGLRVYLLYPVQISLIYLTYDELGVLNNKIGNVAQLLRKVLTL